MTLVKVAAVCVCVASMLMVCTAGMAAETAAVNEVTEMSPGISYQERSIALMEREGFAESIAMMADWEANYSLEMVVAVQPNPVLPESLKTILYCRRFAKLLEDTRGGVTPDQVAAIREGMRHDTTLLRKLVDGGLQSFDDRVQMWHDRNKKSDELLWPLTMRINAQVLLIGERSVTECLPEVLDVPDAMGEHTNWCVVAYACDKILTQMSSGSVSDQQRQILTEYAAWREPQKNSGLFAYQSQTLAPFRSPERPLGRATSTGAPVGASKETVVVEIPATYKVLQTPADNGKTGYLDVSKGRTATAKEVVTFARRVAALKQ